MNLQNLQRYCNDLDERARIIKERDTELYWGNTQQASLLTKQLRDLPQGARTERRRAQAELKYRTDVIKRSHQDIK